VLNEFSTRQRAEKRNAAMTMQYRGHDVVDPNHKLVGTINDVLYNTEGEPTWAVVDVGLLRASHYVPVSVGYTADDGSFVVPFEKRVVTSAPKADRSHTLDPSTESELISYYELENAP
jgi:PRC-barrel domain